MTSQFPDICHRQFFWLSYVFFVKFSYWSKFPVNIITGSGVMTIFFYKRLTRNSEIGNIPDEFWLISGDWGKLKIPNLAWMFLMKCYWMLQNTRAITFIVSELLKESQKGWGWGWLDPPTQITKVANYEEARVKLTNA